MADTIDKLVLCTLADADTGERCQYCGWASGSGHGKVRG